MNTTHTPGPWAVQKSSNPKNGTAWRDIVSLGGEFSPAYVGEALDKDAALMAAAPDLLAVADWLVQEHEQGDGNIPDGLYMAARRAIAKATA